MYQELEDTLDSLYPITVIICANREHLKRRTALEITIKERWREREREREGECGWFYEELLFLTAYRLLRHFVWEACGLAKESRAIKNQSVGRGKPGATNSRDKGDGRERKVEKWEDLTH